MLDTTKLINNPESQGSQVQFGFFQGESIYLYMMLQSELTSLEAKSGKSMMHSVIKKSGKIKIIIDLTNVEVPFSKIPVLVGLLREGNILYLLEDVSNVDQLLVIDPADRLPRNDLIHIIRLLKVKHNIEDYLKYFNNQEELFEFIDHPQQIEPLA